MNMYIQDLADITFLEGRASHIEVRIAIYPSEIYPTFNFEFDREAKPYIHIFKIRQYADVSIQGIMGPNRFKVALNIMKE